METLFDSQGKLTAEGFSVLETLFQTLDPIFVDMLDKYNINDLTHILFYVALELEKSNI